MLHIDGKAARGASEKSKGESQVYHLNAMYEGESVGIEIKRVGENESKKRWCCDKRVYIEAFLHDAEKTG